MSIDWNQLLQGAALTRIMEYAPQVAGALAILSVGWVASKWARALTRRALERANVDAILVPFLSGMVYVAFVVFMAMAALNALGVNVASFIAVLGAAGLAVALAFQGTLSNFASGVMLLTFRPFRVGDYVEVGGVAGTVREVGIFACLLTTGDNVQISVPNSSVFGQTIKNYSASETRRIDLVMGVGYDDDLGVVLDTCRAVLGEDERILDDPEAVVAVHELADSSVNVVVRPWVNASDYWDTRWHLTRELKERLEAAGCSIPYPQRDVHLHQVA